MSKPRVADQTWTRIFHNEVGEAYKSEENVDFFKVVIDRKAKYFYGESAHVDYQRYIMDKTPHSYVVPILRTW